MKFRNILFDNWATKLVSLALSLTLWFYVTSTGKTEMTLTVPLELRNIPQDMAVVGDVAGSLEVRVQGQERALRDITLGKKVIGIIDLGAGKVGENSMPLSPDDIRRPSGMTVTYMSLSEIKIKLEPLIRKTYRLKPVLHGFPANGYRLVKVSAAPAKITVEGPASVVKNLENLKTLPIDIQGADGNLSVSAKIDYQGQAIKLLEKDIEVRITIERMNK